MSSRLNQGMSFDDFFLKGSRKIENRLRGNGRIEKRAPFEFKQKSSISNRQWLIFHKAELGRVARPGGKV